MMLQTYSPNPMSMPSVKNPYTLRFLRYSPDKIKRLSSLQKGQIKVTPWCCTPTTPTTFLTSINFLHLTHAKYSPRSLQQGQRSTQGHTMTSTPQPVSLPSTFYTFRNQRFSPNKILKVKVATARSKVKSRSHRAVAHLHPQPMVLPSINLLYLIVPEIWPGQDFLAQCHYGKVKSRPYHEVAHLHP